MKTSAFLVMLVLVGCGAAGGNGSDVLPVSSLDDVVNVTKVSRAESGSVIMRTTTFSRGEWIASRARVASAVPPAQGGVGALQQGQTVFDTDNFALCGANDIVIYDQNNCQNNFVYAYCFYDNGGPAGDYDLRTITWPGAGGGVWGHSTATMPYTHVQSFETLGNKGGAISTFFNPAFCTSAVGAASGCNQPIANCNIDVVHADP